MITLDALHWVRVSVLAQRQRNMLTILGFAIGVCAVTLLGTLGESLKRFVLNEFTQFGSNIIGVMPGKRETLGLSGILRTNRGLSLADAQSLARLPRVEGVVPVVAGTAEVRFGNKTRPTEVVGVSHVAQSAWKMRMAAGQFLPADDMQRPRAFAVLGSRLHQELFNGAGALGQHIRIAGNRFRVVGVFREKGQFMGMDLDEMVYIPAARALSLFNRSALMEVDVIVDPAMDAQVMANRIRMHMIRRHKADDVTIITQDQMLDTLDGILDVVRFAGVAIGSISLLVGSVGIYSILTISLSQRYAEVGLLRALGMSQGLLMRLFLGEALFIALIGGLMGLLLVGLLQLLLYLNLPQLPALFSLQSFAVAIAVSLLVGLIAGARPAYVAARLPPIKALRSE